MTDFEQDMEDDYQDGYEKSLEECKNRSKPNMTNSEAKATKIIVYGQINNYVLTVWGSKPAHKSLRKYCLLDLKSEIKSFASENGIKDYVVEFFDGWNTQNLDANLSPINQ
jgi:hypothetical protein